jgi:hypothetical protein
LSESTSSYQRQQSGIVIPNAFAQAGIICCLETIFEISAFSEGGSSQGIDYFSNFFDSFKERRNTAELPSWSHKGGQGTGTTFNSRFLMRCFFVTDLKFHLKKIIPFEYSSRMSATRCVHGMPRNGSDKLSCYVATLP